MNDAAQTTECSKHQVRM